MIKLIVQPLGGSKRSKNSVGVKRVVGANGKSANVHTISVSSTTLTNDLERVFTTNVKKARKENQRIIGRTDIAPQKG